MILRQATSVKIIYQRILRMTNQNSYWAFNRMETNCCIKDLILTTLSLIKKDSRNNIGTFYKLKNKRKKELEHNLLINRQNLC